MEEIIKELNRLKDGLEKDDNNCKYQELQRYMIDDDSYSIFKLNIYVDQLLREKQCSIKRDRLLSILYDLIYNSDTWFIKLIMKCIDQHSTLEINRFITILITLPELIDNLYGGGGKNIFNSNNYIIKLCTVIQDVILTNCCDINNHLHCIIRRLFLRGYSELLWNHLLKNLFNKNEEEIVFRLRKLLFENKMDNDGEWSKFIEQLLKIIFNNCYNWKSIANIISFDYIHSNQMLLLKLEFLLTNKFILINHRSNNRFIYNLLAYLYRTNQTWFIQSSINAIDSWSNSNAVNYRSYQQHFYLCRLVILFARLLLSFNDDNDDDNDEMKNDAIKKLQTSTFNVCTMQVANSEPLIRSIFLTTSLELFKLLIKFNAINVELPEFQQIDDDNENQDDCQHLKYLVSFNLNEMFDDSMIVDDELVEPVSNNLIINDEQKSSNNQPTTLNELDSDDDEDDDDLVPYDISNDIPIEDDVCYREKKWLVKPKTTDNNNIQQLLLIDNSKQRPIYLQDCIDGLCNYDDNKADWMRKCLQLSAKIIRSNHNRLSNDISLKFTKILFDLDDKYNIENFDRLRIDALIALCVGSPKIVATYLANRFYAQHISIRCRMDVLAVLTKASDELSQLKPLEFDNESVKATTIDQPLSIVDEGKNRKFRREFFSIESDNDESDDDDVDKRKNFLESKIKSQTRYIRKKQTVDNTTVSSMNRFVPVARYFFFPLIRDLDGPDLKLRINEAADCFIIESLILSLGIMIRNCSNHSETLRMSMELLPFVYSYRNHSKSNVRLAIINTLTLVLISTPVYYFIDNQLMKNYLLQFKIWLQETMINDVSHDCTLAAYKAIKTLTDHHSSLTQ